MEEHSFAQPTVFVFIGLGLIAFIIGYVLLSSTNIPNIFGIAIIFSGFILPVFLIISSYRKYLYYAAFGELVEKATEFSEHLNGIKKLLENTKADENTTPNVPDSDT